MMHSYVVVIISVSLLRSVFTKEDPQLVSSLLSAGDNRSLLRVAFHDDVGTWAIDKYNNAIVHVNQIWEHVSSNTRHVTIGGAGVWVIDADNSVHYRQGVSEHQPQGVQWTRIKGSFKSLAAGKEGFLFGIDLHGDLQCRDGFTCSNPLGQAWKSMGLNKSISHVSCGKRGCWLTSSDGRILFFPGSGKRGCGLSTIKVIELKDGLGVNIDVVEVNTSPSGWRVVAVTKDGGLLKRNGLSSTTPEGTQWNTVVANGNYVTAVPCHMGYIAVTDKNKATFVTNLPKCHDFGVRLTDVDTGGEINRPSTWGTKGGLIYQNQGSTWITVQGPLMKQISTSGDDVWAVSRNNEVYVRNGITCLNAYGDTWQRVPGGEMSQVDSGRFGLVYALTPSGNVFCRGGISQKMKTGISWLTVDGNMTYVSCGDFGCWAIDHKQKTFYRSGIESDNCVGDKWVLVPSSSPMRIVESGHHGLVFGVDIQGSAHARVATSEMDPIGTGWLQMYTFKKFIDISHAQLRILLVDSNRVTYICN